MLKTGTILEVEIIDLNHEAQGVAKMDNFVVFVHGAVTGDFVRVEITEIRKNYAMGKLIEIVKSSEKRINPPCTHFGECGGCQLMNMDYSSQLDYKKTRVCNELRRAGVNTDHTEIYDTMGMEEPFRYRNKTAFSVTSRNNEVHIGPYEQGTYNTVDMEGCLIQTKEADEAVMLFKTLMTKYAIPAYDKKTGSGIIRNIVIRNNRENQLMLIIVTTTEDFKNKKQLINELAAGSNIKTIVQNINNKATNLIMGKKSITLYGEGTITDTIDNLVFTISPETFFQVNPHQTEKMYRTAIEYANIEKTDTCFDIYCGIGTISLMVAKHAKKVYGIEIVEQSIINARENAVTNNITNTEFIAAKAEQAVPRLYKQGIKADIVIVDPPRKGCEKEVIDTIIRMTPDRIVYVSCNPSTLARDIKHLEEGGYELKKVQPLDMFPWSVHVECVILMQNCGIEGKK